MHEITNLDTTAMEEPKKTRILWFIDHNKIRQEVSLLEDETIYTVSTITNTTTRNIEYTGKHIKENCNDILWDYLNTFIIYRWWVKGEVIFGFAPIPTRIFEILERNNPK